jgi:hypothetical protein
MGMSPDIKTLGQTNDAFQAYIDKQSEHMDEASQKARARMDLAIKKFYEDGGWPMGQPVTSGSYQHLSTVSKWSLDHVSDMIEAIRGAVFGGGAIVPPKNSDTSDSRLKKIGDKPTLDKAAASAASSAASSAIKKTINIVEGPEAAISAAAFDIIQGILATFTSVTEAEITQDFGQKSLSPGLDIWVTVMENAFHQTEFFTDETIIQNFYIFDARMSVERAVSQVTFDLVQTDAELVAGYEAQNKQVAAALSDLDIDDDDYDNKSKKYDGIIVANRKYIEALQADMAKLTAGRKAAVMTMQRASL